MNDHSPKKNITEPRLPDGHGGSSDVQLETLRNRVRRMEARELELAASLDRYRDLFESAPIACMVVDEELLIREVNLKAATLLGVERSRLLGARLSDFVPQGYHEECCQHIRQTFGKTQQKSCQIMLRRSDDTHRFVQLESVPARATDGTPMCQSVLIDITGRKVYEQTVRIAQLRLASQLHETENANRELSQYAYAVSHDLKGPLRAIRNYAEFLYEDLGETLTGDQKRFLDGLITAVDQGYTMVEDLLSLSRIGRVPLEQEAADVPDIVDEIRSLLHPPADVEISVEPKWPIFNTDRTLLRQILQNLIANGIKFNERSPKRVEIGWRPAPSDCIDIFVRDNGIGIDAKYWDQIFRIFNRLHTKNEYDGTGIGLAIVQKAAQKLGGSVRLTSEPGNGSTFLVRLPRKMTETSR
ncbi:MAG: sensor histidine kinase [Desulfobacterales bacterium]